MRLLPLLLLALSPCGPLAQQGVLETGTRLCMKYSLFDPLNGEPFIPAPLAARPTGRLFLVQARDRLDEGFRQALRRIGAEIHTYMPERAYLVRLDPSRLDRVRSLPSVRWAGPYHPAYKLDPTLIRGLVHSGEEHTRRYCLLLVDPHRDAPRLEQAIARLGGTIDLEAGGGILMEATLSRSQLLEIAQESTVMWIDRSSPPEVDIDNARIQGGANHLETVAGIDGKGMAGHVCEGVYATHPEFAARSPYRLAPFSLGSSNPSGHGNATAGEIYALGARTGYKGLVPFSQMTYTNYSYVYNTSTRYALTRDLVDPTKKYKCMSATASWGYARTTAYTSRSAEMDTLILDFDLLHTQSQSNAGATSNPRMSRPQAWAKNILSVGGFRHYNNTNPADDCWCTSGSTGPAADGRVGVTLSAYYDAINTTGYGSTSYTTSFGGTSGATPIINGYSQIVIQMFTEGLFGHPKAPTWRDRFAHKPHFTTTKCLMTASSRQLPLAKATRVQQGYGFPSVKDLYDRRNNMLVLDEVDVLKQGQNRYYLVYVKPGTPEFRSVMHHADPAANPSATKTRINSLHMKVSNLDNGDFWWGQNGLRTNLYSTKGSVADDIETHEHVILKDPVPGTYVVEVQAEAVRTDTHKETPAVDADFALVVNGIGGGRDRSAMTLDLKSTTKGEFIVTAGKVPTTQWVLGWTFFSMDTQRPTGMGNLFGLEMDDLTTLSLLTSPAPGAVFAFTNSTSSTVFPRQPYRFPPLMAALFSGITLDAVMVLSTAKGQFVAVSNVDRVTLK